MNKALKIAIIVVVCLIVILTITLFACQSGNDTTTTTTTTTTEKPECTEHKDANTDYLCDECGAELEKPCTDHVDANSDYVCDNCEAELEKPCTEHADANGDYVCDNCEAELEKPCTEHVDANSDYVCDNCEAELENPSEFTAVNDTVYVISLELNVRETPNADSSDNIFKSYKYAASLKRTGYNDSWTRIEIDGKEYYVNSTYVSTNKPVTEFIEKNDSVYINAPVSINIRETTNVDFSDNIITSLKNGVEVTRTGIAAAADAEDIVWARIEFTMEGVEGKVVGYVNDKYLSNTVTELPVEFKECNDQIKINAEKYTLRSQPIYSDEYYVTTVSKDTVLQLTAIATEKDGEGIIWGVVEYEGQTCYIITNPSNTDNVTIIPAEDSSTDTE